VTDGGGTGYALNDVLTIVGGTGSSATVKVTDTGSLVGSGGLWGGSVSAITASTVSFTTWLPGTSHRT